jgi:Holliday junction resolvase
VAEAVTAYQRGNAFERIIADQLRDDGYSVWQTRGSKTIVDVVAIKTGQTLFVQCKAGATGIGSAGWDALFDLAAAVGAYAILADRPKRGTYRLRRITGHYRPHIAGETRGGDWPAEPFTTDDVDASSDQSQAGLA